MNVLYLIELMAIGVFAASGCLAAGRKQLDLIGVLVVAVVTATGGGTLRDLLLNRHPISWIADPNILYVIVASVPMTMLYVRYWKPPAPVLSIADAIGLSVYAIVGAKYAEAAGKAGIVCVIMGTMTGSAGGVIRDTICNDVPVLFRSGYLYASAAIIGCTVYLILQGMGLNQDIAAYISMATIGMVRVCSIIYKWNLPVFRLEEGDGI